MTNRVIIDSTAASPLRVSVAGVDAALAEFNNLIFDGNQSPLRLSSTGYVVVGGISYNDYTIGGKNTNEGSPVLVLATPAGTTPIWFSGFTKNAGDPFQSMWHVNNLSQGTGSSICQSSGNNYFIGVNHQIGAPGTPTVPGASAYISYAIMKNYG